MINVIFFRLRREFPFCECDVNYNDNHTAYNATASVSCKDGFEIQGENFVTCQADGTWSQASCVKSMFK